jgi:hypothetical protein
MKNPPYPGGVVLRQCLEPLGHVRAPRMKFGWP